MSAAMDSSNSALHQRPASVIATSPALWEAVVQFISEHMLATTNTAPFHMAISGGSTPLDFFRWVVSHAGAGLPWERLHLWWVDERCVPTEDPRSNFGQALQNLITPLGLGADRLHPMPAFPDVAIGADSYERELLQALEVRNGLPVLDLVWLGMGEDGHTASLFPGSSWPLEVGPLYVESCAPSDGLARLSLSMGTLLEARSLMAVVCGASKRQMVGAVFSGGALQVPMARILALRPDMQWFFDENAAPIGGKE